MAAGLFHEKKIETAAWWNGYFSPGGGWEKNHGRRQTRIFAQSFLKHAHLDPAGSFTLLDVGCALGDALKVFHEHLPKATLFGMDVSSVAVALCRQELKDIASFAVSDISEISDWYDVIYVSNVLEHFVDYPDKARHLIKHCRRLYIMVPYKEVDENGPLQPDPFKSHQHSFDRSSFDFLLKEKAAVRVNSKIIRCPGAWSMTPKQLFKEYLLKNPIRFILGKKPVRDRYQILYDIQSNDEI